MAPFEDLPAANEATRSGEVDEVVELPVAELIQDDDDEDYDSWSSDSDVGDALDWLDARESVDVGAGGAALASSYAPSRRPNAHGGILSRPLQPMSNRNQKLSAHVRADPLEVNQGF